MSTALYALYTAGQSYAGKEHAIAAADDLDYLGREYFKSLVMRPPRNSFRARFVRAFLHGR
jgi:hypothetical protein